MGFFKKLIKKAQTPTEPGLTAAELILTNTDLQPGENLFTLTVLSGRWMHCASRSVMKCPSCLSFGRSITLYRSCPNNADAKSFGPNLQLSQTVVNGNGPTSSLFGLQILSIS
jgi:hypothetical protein